MRFETPVALWVRVGAVFAAAVLIWLLLVQGLDLLLPSTGRDLLAHTIRAVSATVLTVAAIALACRFLDRRPWRELQLGPPRAGWRFFLLGMVLWLVPAALGWALCTGLGWARVTVTGDAAEVAASLLALVALVICYEALPEELIFRGYLFRNLAERYRTPVVVVAQAALFTLWALCWGGIDGPVRVLLFFTFGLALGACRAATGTVWTGIGFHTAYQVAAQFFTPGTTPLSDGLSRVEGVEPLSAVAFWALPFALGATAVVLGHRARRRVTGLSAV
ncbi:CPBP family intramembrane glutamic endopeptidase [Amycolatopsis albispora]|uniref:CAAX prenyl protease 2/Lysostaphin resistance protein A-like domain-containing protein n=1 Tax=Amycolatopsis albispora TaxID=1804986 RepID=A0A344L5H9_9PSEU|nr:CPBP family intramembrane glutamic endopeptidase [Amycolatopsis albispora]AXB43303.1 hypothetical protein A4R43_12690 [Amycolatopsis albispora]